MDVRRPKRRKDGRKAWGRGVSEMSRRLRGYLRRQALYCTNVCLYNVCVCVCVVCVRVCVCIPEQINREASRGESILKFLTGNSL